MSYIEICTTTDNKLMATCLKDFLLNEKLSPCIQIFSNVDSNYIWNNKKTTSVEFLIKIKTLKKHKIKIIDKIKEFHNYDIPEIISYDISIESQEYEKWLKQNME
tara:strand:- start:258 stop:572 length:315 start_codon:yes stop_codon:yes gene_type:complete